MTGVVDLFAGAGGWDLAARELDIDPVGIELDAAAIATRHAAQLPTIRADLHGYPPRPSDGLIASPPCPAFSAAGNREGLADIGRLQRTVADPARLATEPDDGWNDSTSGLIVQTARWAHHADQWVTLEQVPAVLPVWQALAHGLKQAGWRTAWTGVLNAADYGVPQTRRRAILIAHRTRRVEPPEPTHTNPTAIKSGDLFGGDLLPWVSMADALGWAGRVGFPRRDDRGDSCDGYRERDWFPTAGPAQTVTEKARSWVLNRPATTIQCDPRVAPPGHRDRAGGERQFPDGTIRVEPWEAAALQTFPTCHPWQGTRTAQFRQIGNAIPPLLAHHILGAVQ
ncbi:MAG: DNA cytosine methyltransferase [Actinomycetia bacterium]|nr:DNA cytosine methyltransferase [Actinomycetes bacterium]